MKDITINLPAQLFRSAILSTAWCTDRNSTRYAMSAVAIQSRDGRLYAIATDSRRMMVYDLGEFGEDVSILIPPDSVRELEKRLTKTATGTLTISCAANGAVSVRWIAHNRKERTVEFREYDGLFPRWWQVIPDASEKTGTLKAKAGALRSFLPVDCPGWTFDLNGHVKVMREPIQPKNLDGITYDGQPLQIDFDLGYLAEFLDSLNSDSPVEFDVFDSGSAAVMRSGRANYVVMPLTRDK